MSCTTRSVKDEEFYSIKIYIKDQEFCLVGKKRLLNVYGVKDGYQLLILMVESVI